MQVQVTLIDRAGSLADAARRLGWHEATVLAHTDVADVPRARGTAFVSPANSLGFMDGGVDLVLSRAMFPGVEGRVRAAFRANGAVTRLGRPYLPIGDAVVVDAGPVGVHLVSAPTMWLPGNVSGTSNAYHALFAALRAVERFNRSNGSGSGSGNRITHLVVPGMCTGYGGMSADQAISQMMHAHRDHAHGRAPVSDAAGIVAEQPETYQNLEFKQIDAARVRHV
jgi:O-acetyl-ADP-ribose deacetylase (regulator of RNase III)